MVGSRSSKILKTKNAAKRSKTYGSSSFNTKSGDAGINLNVNAGDDDEDEVQVLPRPIDRDKAKGLKKKKVAGSSGLSASMNDEALARLMLCELATQNETAMTMKKEERTAFLEIKRRDVECREQEIEMQEYRQRQKDIRFYMQPYDHLIGDALRHMEALRVEI
ncbi:hypothetical protein Tco_0840999 [Tanacetum coccineum]|uniref:No apical meristem-associated C-terminal domain-containing protein n=1 Tax=Tanacetum coccineum TaxID=301880 RepID=A0ABQ5AYL9_9ASTR